MQLLVILKPKFDNKSSPDNNIDLTIGVTCTDVISARDTLSRLSNQPWVSPMMSGWISGSAGSTGW